MTTTVTTTNAPTPTSTVRAMEGTGTTLVKAPEMDPVLRRRPGGFLDDPPLWADPPRHLLSAGMVAVRLDSGGAPDPGWADRHRESFTNLANSLLAGRRITRPDAVHPSWVELAATAQLDLIAALGRALDDGATLALRVTPVVLHGWFLVATLHATEDDVLLISGSYGSGARHEARYLARWFTGTSTDASTDGGLEHRASHPHP